MKIAIACSMFLLFPLLAQVGELRREVEARREQLCRDMAPGSIFILFSAPIRYQSHDIEYPYRQSSNFYYLTGIVQPGAALVIFGGPSPESLLFIPPADPQQELWTGKRLSGEDARDMSGIQDVRMSEDIDAVIAVLENRPDSPAAEDQALSAALKRRDAIVYLELEKKPPCAGYHFEQKFAEEIEWRYPDISCRDGFSLIARMRRRKSPYEIQCIREAIRITESGVRRAAREIKPGHFEYEVKAALEYGYQKNGADWAFPSIIASGPNSAFLHYQGKKRRLESGDLLLMDVGASYDYYSADITRTFPVNGKFTEAQREIYELVLAAQQAAIEKVRPGATLNDVHARAVDVIRQGLLRLNLIADPKGHEYLLYFMHDTCHGLGLDTHDPGFYATHLEPGMVITVEPGVYVAADVVARAKEDFGEDFANEIAPRVERYSGTGVRIEDDVLVTPAGAEVLSRLPKTIDEVEKWIKSR